MEHRDVFLLEAIIEYCDQIAATIKGLQRQDFLNNLDARDACALRTLQIGENANHLSEQFIASHTDIHWHEIIGLRNIIAHEYGDIDGDVLWEIVTEDIPALRRSCAAIIGAS